MSNVFSKLELKTAASIWQRGVKSSKRLVGLLVRAIPLIVGANSLSWVKAAFVFSKFVVQFIEKQGHKGLAVYLKACNVSLMRCLAGERLKDPRAAGSAVSLNHRGLPRLIPGSHRLRINQGDLGVIRLWLGFFTLYRVLDFRGRMQIQTIIGEGRYVSIYFLDEFFIFVRDVFLPLIIRLGGKSFRTDLVPKDHRPGRWYEYFMSFVDVIGTNPGTLKTFHLYKSNYRRELWGYVVRLFPLMKSGPNTKKGTVNVANIIQDVAAWVSRPALMVSLISLVAVTRAWNLVDTPAWVAGRWLYAQEREAAAEAGKHGKDRPPKQVNRIISWSKPVVEGHEYGWLGRLSFVYEPGKIRVVAMVDCFTQWLLYPLHRFIFDKILKVIPQDGTFDHVAPVKKLIRVMRERKLSECFSYDLSAATDRLPVSIQELLLRVFTTSDFAYHWRKLLTERFYALPSDYVKRHGRKGLTKVKYAVGQPMGAYSSWAMLALTHHAIVQFAAWRTKRFSGWFDLYAVLGDDVVIGDRYVAAQYVEIMDTLGVEIGFSKSIISKNLSMEFAKRFFYKGVEVTPLPLVGAGVAWLGVSGVPEIVKTVKDRTGKLLSLASIGKCIGLGYKACSSAATSRILDLPNMLRSIVILLTRPGASLGVRDLWEWIRLKRYNSSGKATKGWCVSVMDVIRQRVISRDTREVRKKLFKVFVPFQLERRFTEEVVDLNQWWTTNIKDPYRQPMLDAITEFEEVQKELTSEFDGYSEENLLAIIDRYDHLEALLCKLPTAVNLVRDMSEVSGFSRPRKPKQVRLWRKLSRFGRKSGLV
nr:MAG: RNA-dependent RNA polymerase [Guiyang mito-like virus 14]